MSQQIHEVKIEEAFAAVKAACEAYRGDKREHMALELSLNAIKAKLDEKKEEKKVE